MQKVAAAAEAIASGVLFRECDQLTRKKKPLNRFLKMGSLSVSSFINHIIFDAHLREKAQLISAPKFNDLFVLPSKESQIRHGSMGFKWADGVKQPFSICHVFYMIKI